MPIICLICKEKLSQSQTWTSLLLPKPPAACNNCEKTLKRISGPTCPGCSRPQQEEALCSDCRTWILRNGALEKNRSVYEYNAAMKDLLAAFKFRGDAELVNVFEKDVVGVFKSSYTKQSFDWCIPIPLSEERLTERGFNQAALLANFIPIPQRDLLKRIHHEKQSKKSRNERLSTNNVFSVKSDINLVNKRILLVDDLYTTGSTLQQAAKKLRNSGAAKISAITLIRS